MQIFPQISLRPNNPGPAMLFTRLAGLLVRPLASRLTVPVHQHTVVLHTATTILTNPPPVAVPSQLTQRRTFRDKDILKLRCNACYFKKLDNRWWVLCNKHPRHKQRQKVEDERMSWIVTHITRTGSYRKKHFQYPHQDI